MAVETLKVVAGHIELRFGRKWFAEFFSAGSFDAAEVEYVTGVTGPGFGCWGAIR